MRKFYVADFKSISQDAPETCLPETCSTKPTHLRPAHPKPAHPNLLTRNQQAPEEEILIEQVLQAASKQATFSTQTRTHAPVLAACCFACDLLVTACGPLNMFCPTLVKI